MANWKAVKSYRAEFNKRQRKRKKKELAPVRVIESPDNSLKIIN